MARNLAFVVAGLGVGAGLALMLPRPQPTTTSGELEAAQDLERIATILALLDSMSTDNSPQAARNLAAFLRVIRWAEGTAHANGYRTLFGGALFEGFADHPRQAKRFTDKAGRTLWTSAAGAYQFMAVSPIPGGGSTRVNTWDRLAAKLGLPDFSPAAQDAAAIELIREAGALGLVQSGKFAEAINRVRRIWASLPGAGYSQPEKSLDSLFAQYIAAGGTTA